MQRTIEDGGADPGLGANIQRLWRLISFLATFDIRSAWTIFALMLLRGVLEGYGLFLLLPILAVLGANTLNGSATVEISGGVRWLEGVGVPLTPASLLSLFFVVIVARSVAGYAYQRQVAGLHYRILDHLRQSYHTAIARAQWTYLASQEPAHYSHALTSQADAVAFGTQSTLALANTLFSLLVAVAVAFIISPHLTLFVLSVGIILGLPLIWFDVRIVRLAQTSVDVAARIYEQLGRNLGNLKFFKVRAAGPALEREFAATSSAYSQAQIECTRLSAMAGLLHEIGAALALTLLVYMTLGRSGAGLEPVALTLIFLRVVPHVQQVQRSARTLLWVLPQFALFESRLNGLHRHPEVTMAGVTAAERDQRPRMTRELTFRSVGFHYPSRPDVEVLSNVSLAIPAGNALGIIGLNGAGKTTLVDMAAGLITPTSGSVLLDGEPLSGGRAVSWRRSVSYVLQDDPLINDTILVNLRFGLPEATEEDAWAALKLACADQVVRNLPHGLHSRVGDRGGTLSRGQRQRICLARGLICRPDLLILDEGTSALNPIDEQLLAGTLRSLVPSMTILMISHRLSTLAWVDRICVFVNGALREEGTLGELEAMPGSLVGRMRSSEAAMTWAS